MRENPLPPRANQGRAWLTDVTQKCIPYAKEADLARRQQISYIAAMDRTFERREAFALARPYSALVLGCGTSFLYRDGILCYLSGKMIRVLNVHAAAGVETVIDSERVRRRCWPHVDHGSRVELVHYQERMLSFLYYTPGPSSGPGRGERYLTVIEVEVGVEIDTQPPDPIIRLGVMLRRPKVWVRNNDRYLFCGSHDGGNGHGHREWVLQGYDLHTGRPTAVLPLKEFWGDDLRETLVFEIYDGYLYAVSNRSSYEVEEIDWSSFYHCQRFPVDRPIESRVQHQRIWRRQHREGPINDSWTDLGLHRDECTGQLLIVEARKEWHAGVDAQRRTYYTQPLDDAGWESDDRHTPEMPSPSEPSARPDPAGPPPVAPESYFPDEPLAKLVGKDNDPQFVESRPRIHGHVHPEYAGPEPAPDTFMLSRTRYRTYVPASSAFLDVVIDVDPRRGAGAPGPARGAPPQQVRLRIGSRVRASPLDLGTGLLRKPWLDETTDEPIPESAERFVDRGIGLWPPAGAPRELVELIHPGGTPVGDVSAVEDERSVVFRAAPVASAEGVERPIVLVNFDRGVRHGWLPLLRWDGMHAPAPASADVPAVTIPGKRCEGKPDGDAPVRVDSVRAGGEASVDWERRWWRQEQAMHLNIHEGYRFA